MATQQASEGGAAVGSGGTAVLRRGLQDRPRMTLSPIYARMSGITFPLGFQCRSDAKADWIFFQPGKFIDGANTLNAGVNVEFFKGRFKSDGFATATRPPGNADWCTQADVPGYIPWGGDPLDIFIYFESVSGALGANAMLSFTLLPVVDN